MKRIALTLGLAAFVAMASAATRPTNGDVAGSRHPVVAGPGVIITSSSSSQALAARETAGPDTFVLYGGPDHPTEGKFQLANGISADWGGGNGLPGGVYGGGPDAWTPVDYTNQRVFWHVDTFNTGNLNNNGAGNHAMWCGVPSGDPIAARWVHQPGYGNGWNDGLLYESEIVADPGLGQTVQLDFFFNHDTEPAYDFLRVQYDSAGTWIQVYAVDGSNSNGANGFEVPGVQFSTVGAAPMNFTGNDYGGSSGNRIRLKILITSDGAWSDEDGLWVTNAGAAQVDDITVTHSEGSFFEDFEGSAPFIWKQDRCPFVGDFADVYARLTDIDPCRDNPTPVAGFIDYGQDVRNGPGITGIPSTGGSTFEGIEYGIPGNWVVNYTGGLSFGQSTLNNQILSPEIQWDIPGAIDDDPAVSGALIRFDVWVDLPPSQGFFYFWLVRSAMPGGPYADWVSRNYNYNGSGAPAWKSERFDVSDLIPTGVERVQVALAVLHYGFGHFGPWGASPAPCFDNVALYKYRLSGPAIATRTIDTAQDGFPVSGSIDVSTQNARDALDIPFSMARDVNTGDLVYTPGDSIIVDVKSIIGASTVTDIRMIWALRTNPLFEDAIRAAPGRGKDQNVVAGPAGTIWSGEAVADSSRNIYGLVAGRYFMDLPDLDFMYPGDVLHYYIRATDSDGRVSTLPTDISGFGFFGPAASYDRAFTVRGLPTITDAAGTQPQLLVINDFGRRGGEDEFTTTFRQLGWGEGVDFDTYTVQGPSSQVSNGIGSSGAHGAEAGQLSGYQQIFYFAGDLSVGLLSNGTNWTWNGNDKGNDIEVLKQWHALDPGIGGVRSMAYFGDYIATALQNGSVEGLAYLNDVMGVDVVDADVRDAIGGQTAPLVTPSGNYGEFLTEFVAYGGCPAINEFDQIQPRTGSGAGHYFMDPYGVPSTGLNTGVASVVHPTTYGVDITYPFSMMYVYEVMGRSVGPARRTLLFRETLGLMNSGGLATSAGSAPEARRAELSVFPNPFNPTTTVKFTIAIGTKGFVKVLDLRGKLVRTLHDGTFTGQDFTWKGTDDRGVAVASGVYLITAGADGQTQTVKIALVR